MFSRVYRAFALFALLLVPLLAQCGGGGSSDDEFIELGTKSPAPGKIDTISIAPFQNLDPYNPDCLPCDAGANQTTTASFAQVVHDDDDDRNIITTNDCTLSNPDLIGADADANAFTSIRPTAGSSMRYTREGTNTCIIDIFLPRARFRVNGVERDVVSYSLWVTIDRSDENGTLYGYISKMNVTYYSSNPQLFFRNGTGAPRVTITVKPE